MEWWLGVIGAAVLGLVLGGIRLLLRHGIVAVASRLLDAAHPLVDRWEVRVDTRGRETFARALVLDTEPSTAAALVADAMPQKNATRTSPASWRFRLEREFHVDLVPSASGTVLRAARYDVENGASPYYPADYAGVLRRVRRAARRAGIAVAEGRVHHELSPADGDFSVAHAVGDVPSSR